jgi:histidinol phosphatase-like enzyme
MKKALFITLDNTLVQTLTKRPYSIHSGDWKFIIQTVEAIKDYSSRGYIICLIINQSEVEDGLINANVFNKKVELIIDTLEKDLKLRNVGIKYKICIDDYSYNFLPKPGMIFELCLLHKIDLTKSVLIGSSFWEKDIIRYSGINKYIDITELTYNIE